MCNCIPSHCYECVSSLSFSLTLFLPLPSLLSPKLTMYIDKLTHESAIFSPPAKSDSCLDAASCYSPLSSVGDWEPPSHLFPESESHLVMPSYLQPIGLYSPWNSPGQNTRVGSLSLLQGIFLTQESNWGLLHCRHVLYQLSYQGSPVYSTGALLSP